MLNAAKYARSLDRYAAQSTVCPHCGMQSAVSKAAYSFCNFCEQRIDLARRVPEHEKVASTAFMPVASQLSAGRLDAAVAAAERLLKGNTDPEQLYLLGVFYSSASWTRYTTRDYDLRGFMEANATSIRNALDLTARAKECFYKAIKRVGDAQADNAAADAQLLFIKFMSCVRLHRKTDALSAFEGLKKLDKQNEFIGYAYAVYAVEAETKDADKALAGLLMGMEPNSFYYLARYLAKQKKLSEASDLLRRLGRIASIPLADELAYKMKQALEAAEM